ncbi:MAG: outer membrane lipoprotein carrier protein LolA [Haloarculaceae archaeon]
MTDNRRALAARVAPVVLAAVALALAAAAATGVGAFAAADGPPDGEAVLDRVETRYANAESLVGDATVTVANGTESRTLSVSFAVAGNESRVAVSGDGRRYVAGTNGTHAWVYDETGGTVRVRELPANWTGHDAAGVDGTLPDAANLSRAFDGNTTARTVRTEALNGTETYVVRVEPADESLDGNVTMWVDADDYRVHRVRVVRGDNRTTVAVDAQFNVSVHDSTFEPPGNASGVTVVDRDRYETFAAAQANTSVELRRPANATFESAAVVTRNGRTVALQRYAGEGDLTLAATADSLPYPVENGTTVTVAGENATYVEVRDRAAVVWRDDGTTRAVVADLPRERLIEVAESVRDGAN